MQYIKPYTYFVQKEGGTNNLLMGSLCMLSTQIIPIVGQIVLMGYQAEVAEDLEKDPDISDHANFNFNHFSRYLGRGVWVFLIQLILALFIMLGLVISGGVGFLTYSAIQGDVGIYVGIGVGVLLYMILAILVTMFTWPMTLHVQLSKGFHFGAAFQFSMSFIKKLSVSNQQPTSLQTRRQRQAHHDFPNDEQRRDVGCSRRIEERLPSEALQSRSTAQRKSLGLTCAMQPVTTMLRTRLVHEFRNP